MSDLLPVETHPVGPLTQYTSSGVPRHQNGTFARRRESDSVEISPQAQRLLDLVSRSPVRDDLVERVRAEIEAGRYETEERVNIALERLLEDIL